LSTLCYENKTTTKDKFYLVVHLYQISVWNLVNDLCASILETEINIYWVYYRKENWSDVADKGVILQPTTFIAIS